VSASASKAKASECALGGNTPRTLSRQRGLLLMRDHRKVPRHLAASPATSRRSEGDEMRAWMNHTATRTAQRAESGALLGFALVALVSLASPARATILLFDESRDAATATIVVPTGSGATLAADYGDNATGAAMAVPGGTFTYGDAGEGFTPDVTVDLFTSLATPTDPRVRMWQTGYGDLVNVVFAEGPGTAGSPQLNIRLTATPGSVVDLYGFDLAGFGQDFTIAGVSVQAGATTLFSAANVLVEGDASGAGHTSIAFAAPLSAEELLVTIDLSNLAASIQDNVALDNLRFGQTPPHGVPEPHVLGLVACAALILGRARPR
jgi:hypothetical protein